MNARRIVLLLFCGLLVGFWPSPSQAQPRPAFSIVFEGGTGGVSEGRSNFGLRRLLFELVAESGGRGELNEAGWGALYQGGRYLLPANGIGISSLLEFLDAGGITRGTSVSVPLLLGRHSVNLRPPIGLLDGSSSPAGTLSLLLDPENQDGRFDDVRHAHWQLTELTNASGATNYVLESPNASPSLGFETDVVPLNAWEVRFRYNYSADWPDGSRSEMISLERRIGEGTRRLRWVQEQMLGGTDSIFVSGGNSLEGRSWLPDEPLNLHRPISWDALASVGLSVLVPAHGELAGGLAQLQLEVSMSTVHLISANLTDPDGELVFDPSFRTVLGGFEVAFIGLTPPSVPRNLPPRFAAEVIVSDPSAALDTELARLRAEHPPDLVVLLTALPPSEVHHVITRQPGVDIVIAPSPFESARDLDQIIRTNPGSAPGEIALRNRSPLLLAEAGEWSVGRIDAFASGHTLTEVRATSRAVDQDWETLPRYLGLINNIRHQLYVDGESPIIPDLNDFLVESPGVADVYLTWLGVENDLSQEALESFFATRPIVFHRGIWLNYLANLMRFRTGADVAFVRTMEMPFAVSGQIPEVLVHSFLPGLDEVVLYRVSGEQLTELLNARATLRQNPSAVDDAEAPPAVSGADWAEALVGGRSINENATYTVAMTDYLANQATYAELLGDTEPTRRFRLHDDEWTLVADDDGAPMTLHYIAVDDLRRRSTRHPGLGRAHWSDFERFGVFRDEMNPLFWISFTDIAFSVSNVSRELSTDGFGNVRNTRVNQVDSLAFTGGGTIAFTYDAETIRASFGTEGEYGELRIDDDVTETADDLVAFADFELRFIELGSADLLSPYLTVLYDTQFTPTETDDGGELPRQSELRTSVGLTAEFSELFPNFRLGAFHQADFATDIGVNNFGLEFLTAQRAEVGNLAQTFDIDTSYFFPADDDTDEDLQFKINARVGLAATIIDNLAIEIFADTLWFRGKVDTNRDVGLSVIFGAGLTYSGVFRFTL